VDEAAQVASQALAAQALATTRAADAEAQRARVVTAAVQSRTAAESAPNDLSRHLEAELVAKAADLAVFENLAAKATGEVQRTEKTSAEQLAAAADQVAAVA